MRVNPNRGLTFFFYLDHETMASVLVRRLAVAAASSPAAASTASSSSSSSAAAASATGQATQAFLITLRRSVNGKGAGHPRPLPSPLS